MAGFHSVRAEELARAFDQSFVAARAPAAAAADDFLAVHVAGVPHAVRLAEIDGLHAAPALTYVPSPLAELCGIASLGGALLPVYDLAALLGHRASGQTPWLVKAAGLEVAFAFGAFDGHFRLGVEAIVSSLDNGSEIVRQVVRTAAGPRSVIHIPSLVATIRRRLPPATA